MTAPVARPRWRSSGAVRFLWAGGVAAAFLAGAWMLGQRIERRVIEEAKTEVAARLQPHAHFFAVGLDRRIERVTELKAFIDTARSVAQVDQNFPVFASGLLKGASGVRSLELQRTERVEWVYPLKGNERVLHFDIGRLLSTADRVRAVPSPGGLSVSEPRPTIQGTRGVVVRQHLSGHFPGSPDVAALVIDFDSLLAVASLDAPLEGLELAMLDKLDSVVKPWRGPRPADPVRITIQARGGDWALLAAPVGGWRSAAAPALRPLQIASVLIALMLAWVTFAMVGREEQLRRAVDARTRDLVLANTELRHEVAERERAELALKSREEQLLHSQKMEAMGTLAGGIAHDFNNLLTAIIGFSRLAEERAQQLESSPSVSGLQEMRADIGEVLRAADHASIVTNQLLAFSRKQVVNEETLDVGEVVRGVEVLLRRLLSERIRLSIRTEPRPATVFADRGQLVQVLLNLAVNARDAMPDGGDLVIDVRHRAVDAKEAQDVGVPPGEYVEMHVADNGGGMPPDVLSRAFEPFFTTKGLGKGTGLGLSTVYGIIQGAGGYVFATSEVGRGTEFRVLLPSRAAGVSRAGITAVAADDSTVRATVLVAEDEDAVRQIVTRVLRRRGYAVLEAASGEDALTVSGATEGRIDLLLTDLVMAGISGRVLAEEMRAARPDITVLFMSGYTDEASALGALDGISSAFLAKPFTPDELLTLVRTLLTSAATRALPGFTGRSPASRPRRGSGCTPRRRGPPCRWTPL